VLAIAFAYDRTLIEGVVDAAPDAPRRAILEGVRPRRGTATVLRAIESLRVPHAVVLAERQPTATHLADAVFFKGDVLVGDGMQHRAPTTTTFRQIVAHFRLPPERIWFVTGRDAADAAAAAAFGFEVVYLRQPDDAPAAEPSGDVLIVDELEDLLVVLGPAYTRSALNMRYLMRGLLGARPRPDDD
jgi:phosphoglycolate phosphatase-like HAD superfamily hydrolase